MSMIQPVTNRVPLTWNQKQILLMMLDWSVRGGRSAKSKEIAWRLPGYRGWSVSKMHYHIYDSTPPIASNSYSDDDKPWKLIHWSVNGYIWLTARGLAEAHRVLNEGP